MCVIMNVKQVVGQKVHAFSGYIKVTVTSAAGFLMICQIKGSDTQNSMLANYDEQQVAV